MCIVHIKRVHFKKCNYMQNNCKRFEHKMGDGLMKIKFLPLHKNFILITIIIVLFCVYIHYFCYNFNVFAASDYWSSYAATSWSGSGTENDPYQIDTAAKLAGVASIVNGGDTCFGKYFVQTKDINLSSHYWNPIGNMGNPFSGNYDGCGFSIKGITINTGEEYIGLFGYVSNATIKNVCLNDSNINCTDNINGSIYCGSIAGNAPGSKILGCSNSCSIEINLENVSGLGIPNIGGIVGGGNSATRIEYCQNSGSISVDILRINTLLSIGGIIGNGQGAMIRNCYNTGMVATTYTGSEQGFLDYTHIGGIAGLNSNIYNCFNGAGISIAAWNADAGGLIGQSSGNTIYNSFNTGMVFGLLIPRIANVGGLVGYASNSNVYNSFNTGNCIGSAMTDDEYDRFRGFLIGNAASSLHLYKCYYTSSVAIGNNVTSSEAIALSSLSTQAKLKSWYTNTSNWNTEHTWDFTNTWLLDSNYNSGYPYLRDFLGFIEYELSDASSSKASLGTPSPKVLEINDTVFQISNPTRNGFTFDGWTASGINVNASKSGNSSSLTEWNGLSKTKDTYFQKLFLYGENTVIFTANWTANGVTATLRRNYSKDDETTIGSPPSSNYASTGTKLVLPSPTREGYTFIGWNTKDDGSGKYYTSSTNFNDSSQVEAGHCVATANAGQIRFNLYAIWEANDYKINYNLAGGSHGSSHPTTATYDVVTNISNPTKVGYTFAGWSATTSSGLNTTTAKAGTSNSLSALKTWNGSATKNTYFANLTAIDNRTVTLTANWTANTYTINYSLGDNTSFPATLGSKAPTSATYDIAIEISTPTRVGYVFAGWILSGNNISTAQSGASTTSLSAWSGGANRNRYFKKLTPNASGSVTMTATWQATIASSITATMPAKDSNNEYYLISNIDNLAWLALQGDKANVTGKFRQTNNITIPNNILWLPIGRLKLFSGTYDGQGYTISGLSSYNGTDANGNYLETNGGLFANAGGAIITNVIIENATIYGQNAGIIAGSGNARTNISNCVVSGSVNGTTVGSVIGNGNGANITACLAKGVNTASFAGGSASVDSCIYELNNGKRGKSDTFNNYSDWIYPSNFAYPMPKAFMWYPGAELSADSLNKWLGIA